MKIRTIVVCVFSAITIFASAQEKYSIKGTAGKEMNGKYLYLYQLEDGQQVKNILLDSVKVKKGKFAFSGVQDVPRIAIIQQLSAGDEFIPVILEDGKITVDIKNDRRGGTLLNDTLDMGVRKMKPHLDQVAEADKEFRNLMEGVKPEDRLAKLKNDSVFKKKFHGYVDKVGVVVDSIRLCIDSYKNSLVGVVLFSRVGGAMVYKDTENVKEGASPVFLDHILVQKSIEKRELFLRKMEEERERKMPQEERERREKRALMEAKIKIGERFPDAKVKDRAGQEVALSNYLGKGKYVLIDFWASWCGPCRREMPNVKAAYGKYASKGFEVISISTDAKQKDWEEAMRELGMTWTQLLDVDAGEIYGVFAIPSTFLVDPNGIIIEKGLRGEGLEESLSKIFE